LTSLNELPGKRLLNLFLLVSILSLCSLTPSFAQAPFGLGTISSSEEISEQSEESKQKKREDQLERRWSLGLSGGIYQSNQSGASPGFSLSLAVRYRINLNLANDLALGYAQYGLEVLPPEQDDEVKLTVRQIPITDSVVFFFQPDSDIVPYLITGTGVWITTISGEEIEGLDKDQVSWGGQIGGGIKVATPTFGLNLRITYVMPDFWDSEYSAIQYGVAIGVGQ
jgi:hypothetical protein